VLTGHGIWDKVPFSVRNYLDSNLGKADRETLSMDSPLLAAEKSQYVLIANNDLAMEAAGERAGQLGYQVHLVGWRTGTTKDKIKEEVGLEIEKIWDTLASQLQEGDEVTFASFSTDGVDGSSDLAGAVADRSTLMFAARKGLDPKRFLEGYDSASFFKALALGIETGPTGTNVADLVLVLIDRPEGLPRKTAFIFGGEATVKVAIPDGRKPGSGGRNTHLALLAAGRLARLP